MGGGGKGHKGKGRKHGNCRDFDVTTGSCCERGDQFKFVESSSLNQWELRVEHQWREIKLSETELLSPFEITKKDYLRRIFEVVARGIQGPIMCITEQKGLINLYGDSSHDVYYLLKQIVAESLEPAARLAHQTALLPPGVHVQSLIESAKFILDRRNEMFHWERDSGARLTNLRGSFTAARELLKVFGAPASHASAMLNSLELQYDAHQDFKEKRMLKFGCSLRSDDVADGEDDVDSSEGDEFPNQVLFLTYIL